MKIQIKIRFIYKASILRYELQDCWWFHTF